MSAGPIFIHGLFHTGSTYVWNKFRSNDAYYCYYEPLHHFLLKIEEHWQTRFSKDTRAGVEGHILEEYAGLIKPKQTGLANLQKPFLVDEFVDVNSTGPFKEYFDGLIKHAGEKKALLKMNRTSLRIGWFEKNYPSAINIYVLRNPRDQWQSFNRPGGAIFQVMDVMIASLNKDSEQFKPLAEKLKLFDFKHEDFDVELEFYWSIRKTYSSEELYLFFYYLWALSLRHALDSSSLILDINKLTHDLDYRTTFTSSLAEKGIELDFADCRVSEYTDLELTEAQYKKIEAFVHPLVFGEADSAGYKDKLAAFGPAGEAVFSNRAQSLTLAQKDGDLALKEIAAASADWSVYSKETIESHVETIRHHKVTVKKRNRQLDKLRTKFKNVLIIDPIFRGSRLYYAWMAYDYAEKNDYFPHVLTRQAAYTPQYDEYFGDDDVLLHTRIDLPESVWFGRVPEAEVDNTIAIIKELDEKYDFAGIYFAGLLEYFPLILDRINAGALDFLGNKPVLMVEYNSDYVINYPKMRFSPRPRAIYNNYKKFIKERIKKIIGRRPAMPAKLKKVLAAQERLPGFKLGLLDERAFDSRLSTVPASNKENFLYLPDPCPKIVVDPAPKITSDKIKIFLIGIQSYRKGLIDIVNVLEQHPGISDRIHFFLSGKLEEETEYLRERLEKLAGKIDFVEGYFPEEKIQKYYSETDYVALPYHRHFDGSSGVMAYATVFGKALLTTSHGCIGYRVRRFGLGRVYDTENINELYSVLKALPGRNSSAYKTFRRNSLKFAEAHTINEHQKTIYAEF